MDPRNDDDYDTWEYGTEPLPDAPWNATCEVKELLPPYPNWNAARKIQETSV